MGLLFHLQKIIKMRRNDGTFQEDIQCIIEPKSGKGAIFISNIEAASNPVTLSKYEIGAVISAVKGKNLSAIIPKNIEYLYIPAVDHESFDLSQYFEMSNQLLSQQTKRTNVLVHCMAGVSRSATLVIAYLIFSRKLSFNDAYRLVKSRRKIISPNSSFLKQLQQFQAKLQVKQLKKSLEASTSTSWFSKSRSQVKLNENQYDKNLRAQINILIKGQKNVGMR